MGSSNHTTMNPPAVFCPECNAHLRQTTLATSEAVTCTECGCRFQPYLLDTFGGPHGPTVEEHGDRWRRLRLVPHAQMNWEVGGLGVGWERIGRGLEFYMGLGPLTLSLYAGPGLANG